MEECRAAYQEAAHWFSSWRHGQRSDIAEGEAAQIAQQARPARRPASRGAALT